MTYAQILNDAESRLIEFQTTEDTEYEAVSEILGLLSAAAKKQADVHKANLKAREKESAAFLKKNAKHYADLDKINGNLNKAVSELAGFNAEMTQLRADIAQAENERAHEEAKLDDLHIKRRKAVENPLNPFIIKDQLALDAATKNLDRILDRLSVSTQRLSRLEREKIKAERNIKTLSGKVDNLGRDIAKVESGLEKCQNAITDARNNQVKCSDASLYFDTVSAQLKYSSTSISDILTHLAQLKEELL